MIWVDFCSLVGDWTHDFTLKYNYSMFANVSHDFEEFWGSGVKFKEVDRFFIDYYAGFWHEDLATDINPRPTHSHRIPIREIIELDLIWMTAWEKLPLTTSPAHLLGL